MQHILCIEKRIFSLNKESNNELNKKKHSTIKITERKKVKIKDMKIKNRSSKKKDKNSMNTKVNEKKIDSLKFFSPPKSKTGSKC